MRLVPLWILLPCLMALLARPVSAQPAAETKTVLQMIAPDAVAWGTLKVKDLLADDSIRLMPLEALKALGKTQLGIDPLAIQRVDVVVGVPGPAGLQAGGIVTFLESVPPEILEQLDKVDESQSKGLVLYEVRNTPDVVDHVLNQRQVLVGTQVWVMRAVPTRRVELQ